MDDNFGEWVESMRVAHHEVTNSSVVLHGLISSNINSKILEKL